MTLVYHSGNVITGLSSDTKPTNVPTNSIFIETDTQSQFLFDGSSTWDALGGGSNSYGSSAD